MKNIIAMIAIMLGLSVHASEQDSLERIRDISDLAKCKQIVIDLFEGRLCEDGKIQEDHLAIDYYWGKRCEGNAGYCNRFEDTYRDYLNERMMNNMGTGELTMWSKEVDNGRYVLLHWRWYDMDSGEWADAYFDFALAGDKPQLLYILRFLPEFWREDL